MFPLAQLASLTITPARALTAARSALGHHLIHAITCAQGPALAVFMRAARMD